MADEKRTYETIDEYIADFPEDVQAILQEMRRVIREQAPDADEAISYQIPTFRQNGILVHFAAFKQHVGFYPTPGGIEAFRDELAPYRPAKGSVKFPISKPIPYDLVRRITAWRVAQNSQKKHRKARR